MKNSKDYYLYNLVCPFDGLVKYVGVTSRLIKRKYEHRSYNETQYNRLLLNWKKFLQSKKLKPRYVIVEGPMSIDLILDREIYWIKHYKNSGNQIFNLTNGGEMSAISENHNSKALKGKKLESYYTLEKSKKIRDKISRGVSGIKNPNFGGVHCTLQWSENQKISQSKTPVEVFDKENNFIAEFLNSKDCALFFNAKASNVRTCKSEGYLLQRKYKIVDKVISSLKPSL